MNIGEVCSSETSVDFRLTARHCNYCFITLRPWIWRRYVPPKRWLTFTEQCIIITVCLFFDHEDVRDIFLLNARWLSPDSMTYVPGGINLHTHRCGNLIREYTQNIFSIAKNPFYNILHMQTLLVILNLPLAIMEKHKLILFENNGPKKENVT
jgi:hypothetical protein